MSDSSWADVLAALRPTRATPPASSVDFGMDALAALLRAARQGQVTEGERLSRTDLVEGLVRYGGREKD